MHKYSTTFTVLVNMCRRAQRKTLPSATLGHRLTLTTPHTGAQRGQPPTGHQTRRTLEYYSCRFMFVQRRLPMFAKGTVIGT